MPTPLRFGNYTFDLEMPDLPEVLMRAGRVPNPVVAATVVLLAQEGSITNNPDDPSYFPRNIEEIRGMYAVLELCCVGINGDPTRRFQAFDRPIRPGNLGPQDIGHGAVVAVYWSFFRGGYRGEAVPDPAIPADPGRAEEPAPTGDDLAPPAE